MKLTVSKYLNARTGMAAVSAPCNFYRSPGNTISIDDVVTGDEVDGNSIWYHSSEDGCFYWSGGIEQVVFEMKTINELTDKKEVVVNEAIKYFWNDWKKDIAGFTGAFTGDKTTGGVVVKPDVIVFQVIKKTGIIADDKLLAPSKIIFRGVSIDTDVIEASFARPNLCFPGATISRIKEMDEWGTVSLKVFRKEEDDTFSYLLTNYHVAAFDLLRAGQFKYRYPAPINNRQVMVPFQKGNASNKDFIGALYEGRLSPYYDVALILLNEDNLASNKTIDGVINGYEDVFKNPANNTNKNVTMYGAASGKVISIIRSMHSHQVFNYAGGKTFDLLELIQLDKCSAGGDSGSPVLLGDKIIGINVGADDKFTYVIPIKRILEFFNLKISQP